MEKAIAIKLLTDTLQKPFDEAQFCQFARNLVNDLDESKAFQAQGNYIKDAYKQQVRQYKRIGQYVDPDENTVDILVVRLQKPTSLDRARTMQRNFIAQYLQDRDQKEAALVAYTTDDSPDWRFSLVRLDYRLEQQADGSYKPKKEVTAARRSSFLVGETEPNNTAQQQLLPLLLNDRKNPTLDELEAAFNIESVTKEFFERYKSLFLQVRDEVEALRQSDSVIADDFAQKQIDPANFAKKLLGQIVFLYFLQKKGWMGVTPGQPWGSGAKDFLRRLFRQENVEYDNFFNDVLEPLFYQALAVDRGSEALYELPGCQQPCKIPFLNGGLFEPIGGYDWQATNIFIANETIQTILDKFDRYNFTVREDEPLDKEVAVDPEMLGKVFENLLEVKDRKSKGAFYTPREIVHYMCQESLINYLDTTINRQLVEIAPPPAQQTTLCEMSTSGQVSLTQEEYCERVPRGDLERLVRQGEQSLENDAQVVQKGSETKTYQFQVPQSVRTHAADIDRALADIKICDPAIGSGAFPVGMMQEIVKVRGVLTTYLTLMPSPNPLPRERASGTPPSPWGEGGWGDEGRTPYAFKRHAIQSSIYGVDIDPGAVDIARLRLWLSLVVDEEDYTRIKPLPNLDYKIVCGNSLLSVEKDLLNYQILEELEQRIQEHIEETDADRKAVLHGNIQGLIKTITNQDETFDFEVYFSEVFRQHGGFDVVIGNPPYVDSETMKRETPQLREKYSSIFKETAKGNWDLFIIFIHQGIKILRKKGFISYITPNKLIGEKYSESLRKFISKKRVVFLRDYSSIEIFNEADVYPIVFLIQNTGQKSVIQMTTMESINSVSCESQILPSIFYQDIYWDIYFLSSKTVDLFTRLAQLSKIGKCFHSISAAATVSEAYLFKDVIIDNPNVAEYESKRIVNTGTIDRYRSLWSIKPITYIKDRYQHPIVLDTEIQKISSRRFEQSNSNKIIIAGMTKTLECFYDEGLHLAGKSTTIILGQEENLKFLTAILNSKLISFWYFNYYKSRKMAGGYINVNQDGIKNIPIPDWNSSPVRISQLNSIVELVEQMQNLNNQLDIKPNDIQLKESIQKLDQKIDQSVYELYGLTDDEIAIVEGEIEA